MNWLRVHVLSMVHGYTTCQWLKVTGHSLLLLGATFPLVLRELVAETSPLRDLGELLSMATDSVGDLLVLFVVLIEVIRRGRR